MTNPESLSDAIQRLAQKKQHVVTPAAIEAKKELDMTREEGQYTKPLQRKMDIIHEFDESIRLLSLIFQKSRFDEMAVFLSNPAKIIGMNFFAGIFRGIGFVIGAMLIAAILIYMSKNNMQFVNLSQIAQAIQAILS
jgi:hypothetical protein